MMQCDNNQYGISFDSDGGQFVNQLLHSSENRGCLSLPVKQSLVLDGEKGELVKACGKVGRKRGVSETKTAEALRSHSEAERRRRERINAHLESLRGLVPSNEKVRCSNEYNACFWSLFTISIITVDWLFDLYCWLLVCLRSRIWVCLDFPSLFRIIVSYRRSIACLVL